MSAKLVNLGSVCIDNVYQVPNLSRSGETVLSSDYQIFPGGKGLNQSLAAAKAGVNVEHHGRAGADGSFLLDILRDSGVAVDGIEVSSGPSGHSVIQVDPDGQNAIVIVGGSNREITRQQIDHALSRVDRNDWLLLQNEINDLSYVLEKAAALDLNTAFNVAPAARPNDYKLDNVDLLILNEVETQVLTQSTDLETATDELKRRFAQSTIVVTMGGQGLHYVSAAEPAKARQFLPATSVQAVDETAAGDAFVGYLMAGLIKEMPLIDALNFGSAAGALAVTKAGAASSIPRLSEVNSFLEMQAS